MNRVFEVTITYRVEVTREEVGIDRDPYREAELKVARGVGQAIYGYVEEVEEVEWP